MKSWKKAIKKIALIAGAGAMIGATLAGAMAVNSPVEKFMEKAIVDGSINAYVVVGANAATADVVGAVDITAAFAQKATTTETVNVPGATASVTGGAQLYDADHKLRLDDNINAIKSVLTSDDLELLKSGKVEFNDRTGNTYNYDQYIFIGDQQIKFGDPDTNDGKDADYYIDTSSGNLYQAKIVFTEPVNLSKITGQDIELFGNKYTIWDKSKYNGPNDYEIKLFGAAEKVTVNAGEETTVTLNGQTYTIKVIGVDSQHEKAVIEVNGEQQEVSEEDSLTLGGLPIYVKNIFAYDVPQTEGGVELSVGTQEVKLEDGNVYLAGSDEPMDGVTVDIHNDSNKFITDITFNVTPSDLDVDFMGIGDKFTDPLFKSFSLAFLGVQPGEDSREQIKLTYDGDKATAVEFTAKGGYDVKLPVIWYNETGSYVAFADKDGNAIAGGGANVPKNGYIFTDAGGFIHLWKVTDVDNSSQEATLKDMVTGKIVHIKGTSAYIDGQQFNVSYGVVNNEDTVNLTWTTGADYNIPAPYFETQNGAYIIYGATYNYSFSSLPGSNVTVQLPGRCNVEVNLTELDSGTSMSKECLGVEWNITDTDNTGSVNLTVYPVKLGMGDHGLIFVTEEDEGGEYYEHAWNTTWDSTDKVLGWNEKNTSGWVQLESNDDLYKRADVWGTIITKDTSDSSQKVYTISYPDTQAYIVAAVGENPQMGGGAGGEVTTTVVHYVDATSGLARLDNEMTAPDKPVILVGGPNANALTAEFADELSGLDITEGKAVIKYIENAFGSNPALIVAGFTADDTRFASKVVAYKMINEDAYPDMDDSTTVIITNTGAGVSNPEVEKVE